MEDLPVHESLTGIENGYLSFDKEKYGYLVTFKFPDNDSIIETYIEAEWHEKNSQLKIWDVSSDKKKRNLIVNLVTLIKTRVEVKILSFNNVSNIKTVKLIIDAFKTNDPKKYLTKFNWKFKFNFFRSPLIGSLYNLGYKNITIKLIGRNPRTALQVDSIIGELSNEVSFEIIQ